MKLNIEIVKDLQTRKILRDLWGNKARTVLVVLTIAIGVYSVGSISRAWVILSTNLTDNYLAAAPASATISTAGPFDNSFVESVRRMPEIAKAEGRNGLIVRVKVGSDRWHLLRLIVRADYNDLSLDKIQTQAGSWPPPRQSLLLERSSQDLVQLGIGDTATIRLPDGNFHEIQVAGIVHDLTQTPTDFTYIGYGYITKRTLSQLTGASNYNNLDIIVANQPLNKRHIQDVVELVVNKMEANGLVVTNKDIPNPGVHQLNDIIQSVLQLLVILTLMAVFLGIFLEINIVSALLAQQVQQIGAIKAIGGRSGGIAAMYLKTIVIFGILALVIAVPLSMIVSWLTAVFVANFINFDITNYDIPPQIYALEIATGVLLPCLAALYPILNGTRITVREAIQQSGIQTVQFGTGGFEELLNKMRGLPPIVLYAFRNIFRRKVRLALATLTLSIAGAVFISVISVRNSLIVTIDEIANYWQEDVMLAFYRPHRLSKIEQVAANFSNVSAIEGRLIYDGFRIRADGRESTQQIKLFGLDPNSRFIQPTLLEGRWLQPDDQNNIVVNVDFLELEPDIKIGDEVTLRTEQRETVWQVVGIATSQVIGGGELLKAPIAYANYPQLAEAVGQIGMVNRLLVAYQQPDAVSDKAMVNMLENGLQQANMRVVFSLLNSDVRQSLRNAFAIIINLVQLMSFLFAIVGGLGLMSMMSLNVLERTQEIGIIRVVGGIGKVITQIVIIESIVVGLLSWLVGSLLAYPVSKLMSIALGNTMLNVPLTHVFPLRGLVLWLLFILVLAVLASVIPARSASRLVIRETLSYE